MNFLTLAEAMLLAEAATGIDAATLRRVSRVELLDSALHAPRAGFGDVDVYPDLASKAAVLAVRISRNHPLPDGNKRLAWLALLWFLESNGVAITYTDDEAVDLMLGVAAGLNDLDAIAARLKLRPSDGARTT